MVKLASRLFEVHVSKAPNLKTCFMTLHPYRYAVETAVTSSHYSNRLLVIVKCVSRKPTPPGEVKISSSAGFHMQNYITKTH